MDLEALISCDICLEVFDEHERKPLFLPCGHTSCKACLQKQYKNGTIECAFDRKKHNYRGFDEIPVNYAVIQAVDFAKSHGSNGKSENLCSKHSQEKVKFYCKTHRIFLCQECMSDGHLGKGHEVIKAENVRSTNQIEKAIEECKKHLSEQQQLVNQSVEATNKRYRNQRERIQTDAKELMSSVQSNLQIGLEAMDKEYETKMKDATAHKKVVQDYDSKISRLKNSAIKEVALEDSEIDAAKELIKNIESVSFHVEESSFEFGARTLLDQSITKRFLGSIENNRPISAGYKKLLDELRRKSTIKSDSVYSAMGRIDRANFVESRSSCYVDRPQGIGYGATISAPHMHANTLEHLKDFLVPGAKAIDIGVGSGFMTAVMCEFVGATGLVIGVEHIKDLSIAAMNNIRKGNEDLVSSKRIIMITGDGRKGVPENAPYNVIHVGGSMDSIPSELETQLACGGRMWIPVGPDNGQAIYLVDKSKDGTIKTSKLMNVNYGRLTTVEKQLNK